MYGWKALGFKTYKEYLKHWIWKDKRTMMLELAKYKCQKCGNEKFLEVHHKSYENVGNESQKDLIVLCNYCHWKEHNEN